MALPTLPYYLPKLTAREAISDTVYRACEAYDNNDWNMLLSAMTPDAVLEFNGQIINVSNQLKTSHFEHVGAMDTTHFVTNVRIYLENESATTAKATANSLNQHYPSGKGLVPENKRLLAGVRYYCELVKDERDSLWKMQRFLLKAIWREGDRSVMVPEQKKE